MITFGQISQADFNSVQFVARGDGTTTVLKLNLSKPPFNLNFTGAPATSYVVDLDSPFQGTAAAVLQTQSNGDVVATVTFTQAPPADSTIDVPLTAVYSSLP